MKKPKISGSMIRTETANHTEQTICKHVEEISNLWKAKLLTKRMS